MDFSSIIATWQRVLLKPGEEAFVAESQQENANLTTAIIWMVIAGVIGGILSGIQAAIFAGAGGLASVLGGANVPPQVASMMGSVMGSAGFAGIITIPVFFLIGSFIVHLLATVLGGQGDYGKLAYLMATYQAPITIVGAVLGLIPFLGGCVAALLGIYGLVLEYFAVKVNYGLESGRAIAVVLIPIAILILLAVCGIVVFGMMLAGLSN